LLITVTILLIALKMTVQTLTSVNKLSPVNRETAIATTVALSKLEELRSVPFDEIFARYNDLDADDPGGVGTAAGGDFAVPFLEPRAGDPDGLVGRIDFPTVGDELREDVVDRDLGMPRDLDGDGAEDTDDHAGDYAILPVRVRIEWTGRSGDRSIVMYTSYVSP
jgi:hypothetical protein